MAPKKKKAQAIQRGFATISIAKKKDDTADKAAAVDATEVAPQPLQNDPTYVVAQGSNVEISTITNGKEEHGVNAGLSEWDAREEVRKREEHEEMLDRVKNSSEKEAAKVIKVMEYEKRLASSYQEFYWDDPKDLCGRVVDLGLEEADNTPLAASTEPREKLVVRLATLYRILQKLGFQASQIEQCLSKCPKLDTEDAINWIYLRFTPDRTPLGRAETSKPYGLGDWDTLKLSLPTKAPPKGPAKAAQATEPKIKPVSAAAAANALLNAEARTASIRFRRQDSDESSDDDSTAFPTKAAAHADASSALPLLDDDEIADNPDAAYVQLKLQATSLQRQLGLIIGKGAKKHSKAKANPPVPVKAETTSDLAHLQAIEAKLKSISQMYLFSPKKAEAAYLEERSKLDKAKLAERLAQKLREREATASHATKIDSISQAESPGPTSQSPAIPNSNTDESILGELMSENSDKVDSPASEEPLRNESGNVITIRPMHLPKGFTGKTPRSLLDEALRRTDKYAKTTYRIISGGRAVRAVVSIRWEATGQLDHYGMADEACENQDQAFQLLPANFRILWDELEERKKSANYAAFDEHMKLLSSVAEKRAATSSAESTTAHAVAGDVIAKFKISGAQINHRSSPASTEDLQRQLLARQSSALYAAMLPVRQSLPIAEYRDMVVATVEENQAVVLCGETGCGKSTQTPAYILESELAKGNNVRIICTEPRRISAISLAQRVSQELGDAPGMLGSNESHVGYNIRLETRTSAATRLTFVTTGILMRMLESDTELSGITHVIIDEVHERSIDSDFLLIILRQLMQRRRNLRVLLMSATVDAEKLSEYMGNCPVLTVPGRTFPVNAYFLEDAVEVSGYRLDIGSDSPYVQRYRRSKRVSSDDVDEAAEMSDEDSPSSFRAGYSKDTLATLDAMNESMINYDLLLNLLETICFGNAQLQPFSAAILIFLPSLEAIRKLCDVLECHSEFGSGAFQVFPLHSSVSNEQQSRVFLLPPRGVRKIVVSTNIAETGVTIPDITCVIDSGRHKEMRFDEKRQISRLIECWTAQSNALQRRGRAGRVQEGICFHLFTNARLETQMAEHPLPEMLRLSLQDLSLRIKILEFTGSIEDTLLQALDPPLSINIQRAINSLIEVKALTVNENITQLGRHLAKLPLDVHNAKLCLLATIFGCLDAALTIAAALNNKSVFVAPFGREVEANTIRRSFSMPDEHSDFLLIYRAYRLWRANCENGNWSSFCRKHFISHQNMILLEELKVQFLENLQSAGFIGPANGHTKFARCPRVRFSKIEPVFDRASQDPAIVMACVAAAMYPKLLYLDSGHVWKTLSNNAPIAIHPSSSNFVHGRRPDFGNAHFITFFNIQQTKRLYVWENGIVADKAVMILCGDADVKHYAHSMSIDRRIKRHLERDTGLAIDLLRCKFEAIMQAKLCAPDKPLSSQFAKWFELLEEAISSPKEDKGATSALPVNISIVRPIANGDADPA